MSRSTAQFNLRPGVGGVPPIVSPPQRRVSFGCTVTDAVAGDVTVSGGNAILFLRYGDDPLCTLVSSSATDFTGLVNGDVLYAQLDFTTGETSVAYEDSNTDTVTTYEKSFGTFALSVAKSAGLGFLPSTTVWAVPLCRYDVVAGRGSLHVFHEGDLHVTLPMFQVSPP